MGRSGSGKGRATVFWRVALRDFVGAMAVVERHAAGETGDDFVGTLSPLDTDRGAFSSSWPLSFWWDASEVPSEVPKDSRPLYSISVAWH